MSDETRQLAEFVYELHSKEIPESVREQMRIFTIDNFASGLLGGQKPWYDIAARVMIGFGANGSSGAFRRSERFDSSRASFLNGIAVGGFETDHIGGGHPGGAVFPAVLSLAESLGSDGETFVRALVAGYEVNCRVGTAQTGKTEEVRGFHNPAVSGVFGAAAGCAVLFGLSVEETLWALGIAGSSAAGLVEYVFKGEMTKRLHLGRTAQLGLEAAVLAKEGFTGPGTILEGPCGYLQAYSPEPKVEKLVDDLGTKWAYQGVRVKPYPGHATTQVFVPPLLNWMPKGFDASGIEQVQIKTTTGHGMEERYLEHSPTTLLGAQYSIPFMIGVALARGVDGVIGLDEEIVNDPLVRHLSEIITFEADDRFKGHLADTGAEITLTVKGAESVIACAPIPKRTNEELRTVCSGKLVRYAQGVLPEGRVDDIFKLVDQLESMSNISGLADLVFKNTL